ncbi:ABC1 kinase family protein [Opitutus terrae]|uniref:ABC-1 domain protein n=1 Tax=Opitutus terrae (strain DSM 11246 / JCM 15787 / PB90-1) TaxID=452637 RepID=B1ZZY7_OPITP|nr:AarF/UbiB family protein [Opitutus terrae]ACB77323.1 ABC-1 domain protein [Opitutus terrae PB90-1]
MKLSPNHLKRYKEIARLLWKYGRSDLVQQIAAANDFDPAESGQVDAGGTPEQLAADLEAMGPTYVKLGQVLAGRPDLLPEAYVAALARLQDSVKPFPYAEVEQIVMSELGVRISKAFSRFDTEPMAAASLGQVHFAQLRDGRPVVVKVQRPNIRAQIADDFEVLGEIATFLDEHTAMGKRFRFSAVLEEFRQTIQDELNYQREVQNLIKLGENLREYPRIIVPQPVVDYSTSSVLTMDYVNGRKVTTLSPLARLDLEAAPLIEELFRSYLKQVLVDGIFHADPHPGNVFITDDGQIALLDLGMVGHVTPGMQDNLLKILLALSEGKGEEAAEIVIRISERVEGFDPSQFRRQISQLVATRRDRGLDQMKVGRSLLDVSQHARDSGLIVPSELTLLGKTLLQLDEVGRILDPEFDPNASIQRNVSELMSRRMKRDLSQGNLFSSLLEMKDFLGSLPGRLNRIMDAITDSQLQVKVKAVDADVVLEGMQKIANRITAGVVLAALIVGASLLMQVDTRFRILGYPGLAIVLFLAAAAGAFYLVGSIFLQDYRSRKRLRK